MRATSYKFSKMSSTAVISLKPFQMPEAERSDIVYFTGMAIRAVLTGEPIVSDAPSYVNSPIEAPVKPHLFKRLYQQALDRASVSYRVTQEQLAKLLSVEGWQDKVRRIVYGLNAALGAGSPDWFDDSLMGDQYADAVEADCDEYEDRFVTADDKAALFAEVTKMIHRSNQFAGKRDFFLNLTQQQLDKITAFYDHTDFESMIQQYDECRSSEGKISAMSVYCSAWIRAIKKLLQEWN